MTAAASSGPRSGPWSRWCTYASTTQIAAGFRISVGTAHAYVHTVIDLLAHRAPGLTRALRVADAESCCRVPAVQVVDAIGRDEAALFPSDEKHAPTEPPQLLPLIKVYDFVEDSVQVRRIQRGERSHEAVRDRGVCGHPHNRSATPPTGALARAEQEVVEGESGAAVRGTRARRVLTIVSDWTRRGRRAGNARPTGAPMDSPTTTGRSMPQWSQAASMAAG